MREKLYEYRLKEAEILLELGEIYLEKDQNQEALQLYQKIDYPEGEAYTHDLIGDTHLSTRNINPALEHYQKASQTFGS